MTKFDVVRCANPYKENGQPLWYVMEKTGPRRYLNVDGILDRKVHWFTIRESARAAIKKFRKIEQSPEIRTAKVCIKSETRTDRNNYWCEFTITGNKGFSATGSE